LIQLKNREVAEASSARRSRGTAVLFDVVRDPARLPRAILSISSVAAHHGQGDYCAANAFLDAFAATRTRTQFPPPSQSNGPAWREVGILTEMKTPAGLEARKETLRQHAIFTKDGVEIFQRIVTAQMPQVIVSPRDLDFVIAEAAAPLPETNSPDEVVTTPVGTQRTGVTDEPRDDVEKAVAAIWSARISSCRWNAPQHSNNSKPMLEVRLLLLGTPRREGPPSGRNQAVFLCLHSLQNAWYHWGYDRHFKAGQGNTGSQFGTNGKLTEVECEWRHVKGLCYYLCPLH